MVLVGRAEQILQKATEEMRQAKGKATEMFSPPAGGFGSATMQQIQKEPVCKSFCVFESATKVQQKCNMQRDPPVSSARQERDTGLESGRAGWGSKKLCLGLPWVALGCLEMP